ncbi:MAG: Rrf2 family transcriptional regulator [Candidatus Latescibacteria bacterium]|nr:Rrf2 family transcriptional regulator [Candidatus Latescibacterota bacterium]
MPFSQATKYCIRAVLYLAEHSDDKPVMSRQIAKALRVPEPFLAKILQQLSKRGLLCSFKGRGGGFVLARPASQIHLGEVVEAVEGSQFGEECILGLEACSSEDPCPLHDQWSRFKVEMLGVMRVQSIEEVMQKSLGRKNRKRARPV